MKLSNNTHSDFGLSYQTVMNNQCYTIRSGITRPCQFSLGNIPTINGITDSLGEGWDDRKNAKFFIERNNIVNGQEEEDYLFGQRIMNEASSDDKEYLQLYESWCLFAYREFYKNLLVILDELSLRTYGGKKQVFKTDFANSLICMMMKKYKHI